MFKVIRIYDFIKSGESDFEGVFVDRLYPRGVRKEIFEQFLWLKSVTPSNELRAWFHFDKEGRFEEFCAKFRRELQSEEAQKGLKILKDMEAKHKNVALLTAVKEPELSHVKVILQALKGK
ncbi:MULTISPECIES: DUF488 domain-containing protein [Campylobacter]|uniref:DUF488 domain-containing protein n=1 Tax=Campylobacter TaxID=194 RepID=UPI0014705F3C|nr:MULTISPECIES: DUF488 family protein [Campylobacter]MBN7288293.1 DUF488 family protein [Campylobacter curvus]MDU6827012.1 DUF488 family protein [Campylobacter sp.]